MRVGTHNSEPTGGRLAQSRRDRGWCVGLSNVMRAACVCARNPQSQLCFEQAEQMHADRAHAHSEGGFGMRKSYPMPRIHSSGPAQAVIHERDRGSRSHRYILSLSRFAHRTYMSRHSGRPSRSPVIYLPV